MTNELLHLHFLNSTMMKLIFLVFIVLKCHNCLEPGEFLGCYKIRNVTYSQRVQSVSDCIRFCKDKFYRYANLNEMSCLCSNFLNEEVNSTAHCNVACTNCDDKEELSDTYFTGNLLPGAPRYLRVKNVTDTSAHISWQEPESYTYIKNYKVKANVLRTYSSYPLFSPEWLYTNTTFRTELVTLLPASKYNITIRAIALEGEGPWASYVIDTKLGEPDNRPPQPTILNKEDTTLTVRLNGVVNNNGPISAYQVIVINEDAKQGFQPDKLLPVNEAKAEGYDFYIAAELDPKDINKDFIVGDGRHYGKYYNAPLDPSVDYRVVLSLVSRLNDSTKVAYSDSVGSQQGVIVINVTESPILESPAVIITLSVAIALLSCVLIAGLAGFYILKRRINRNRQRLTNNQELTLQGPMIEIENSGYIPEEDQPVNHYKSLKQKVKTIPYSFIQVDQSVVLGKGKFGSVNAGTLRDDGDVKPIIAYTIFDKRLQPDEKRSMLKDLDLLIRTGVHQNVISLIGTSETADTVCVVLEYTTTNLKEFLLSSRKFVNGRFTNLSETQIFDVVIGVASGMQHLSANRIVHKQICARSIMLGKNLIPKVSGYGLAQYCPQKLPDYTRWTAGEVFRGLPHTSKSDVWSFACLFWETCTIGGTPYGTLLNREIPEKVTKGIRLPQLPYMSSNLYQLLLNCWQLDPDERPDFGSLVPEISELRNDYMTQHLSFNVFPDFQYENYYQDIEFV